MNNIFLQVLIVAVILSVLTYKQKNGLDDARRTKTNVVRITSIIIKERQQIYGIV